MIRQAFFFLFSALLSLSAYGFEFGQYCDVFPGPAQTHERYSGSLWIHPDAQISGAEDFQVGFEHINIDGTQIGPTTCEYDGQEGACQANSALTAPKLTLPEFKTSDESLSIASWNQEDAAPGGQLAPSVLRKLELNGVTITFQAGEYWIDELILNSGSVIHILPDTGVKLHFNTLRLNGQSQFNNQGKADNLLLLGHRVNRGEWDALHLSDMTRMKALIYTRGDVILSGRGNTHYPVGAVLTGSVTAKNVVLRGNSRIIGESQCFSTEKYLLSILPSTASASACERIPLLFEVQNESGKVQSHINGSLNVSVVSKNDHACWALEAEGTCHSNALKGIEVVGGKAAVWLGGIGDDIFIKGELIPDDGSLTPLRSIAGPYHFEPLGFRVRGGPIYTVAGKTETVVLEAVKPVGSGQYCQVQNNYDGPKSLVASTHHEIPWVGDHYPSINGTTIQTDTSLELAFNHGEANFDIRYPDAGQVNITLFDPALQKRDAEPQPTEGEDDIPIPLKQQAQINLFSRPYTLAICGELPSDDDLSNEKAFKKAGQPFDIKVKPVIWMPGDLEGEDLKNGSSVSLDASFCERAPTPGFWHHSAYKATVTLDKTARVVSPADGVSGFVKNVIPKRHAQIQNTDDSSGYHYLFSDLSLNEVGIFSFQAMLKGAYMNMTVNPGERIIGRFKPSHFSLKGEVVPSISPVYDSEGKGFTYLGQHFYGNYTIHAMTTTHEPVKNYHRWQGEAAQSAFEPYVITPSTADGDTGYSMSERWWRPTPVTTWDVDHGGYSQLAFVGNDMIIKKAGHPDGPFLPLRFGVAVTRDDRDKTDFRYCDEHALPGCRSRLTKLTADGHPELIGAMFGEGDFLFGRMRIEGFTETQDFLAEQTLPVAVEVFDGQRFVTNTRDNASFISTDIGEKAVLFSSTPDASKQAQIYLEDEAGNKVKRKTVKNGRSGFLVSPPVQNGQLNREQFRYWQKLGEGVLPQLWLQHSWQGTQFDDDPSAIGTFGFYRGSDRVIYKGEKNITLTGE